MKILFMTSWYPTPDAPVGGVFVREHARAVALRHEVQVLHLMGKDSHISGWWDVTQETDPSLTLDIPTWRVRHRPAPLPGASSLVYLWAAQKALDQVAESGFAPDLIHAHIYEAGWAAALIGKKRGLPVVITEHNSDFPRRRLPWLQVQKARYAFCHADRILPVSLALQQAIQDMRISGNFTVVPNVVDTDLFFPSPSRPVGDEKRLLFVGSLIPVKGIDHLFHALATLHENRQDWRLDLIGDGYLRAEYTQLAANLGIAPRVTFHGALPKAAVAQAMRQADFFVLPSLWENLPCVLLEAQATGLPIVASQIGGIPEIVDIHNGLLADAGDEAGLSTALGEMLETLETYDRAAIVRHAQRYSFAAVGDMLDSIYQEVSCN